MEYTLSGNDISDNADIRRAKAPPGNTALWFAVGRRSFGLSVVAIGLREASKLHTLDPAAIYASLHPIQFYSASATIHN